MGQVILLSINILAQIKSTVDTEMICEHYLGLIFKKKGKRKWALCPVHGEKTPSLCLFPDDKLKCFGCQFSGDGLDLISAVMGRPLSEIIKMVSIDYGLQCDMINNSDLRRKIEQGKRDKQMAEQFRHNVDTCFNKLAFMLRGTYAVKLQSEKDLNRVDIAAVFDLQTILECLLDDLMNADIELQFAALQRARRYGLWE